MLIMNVMRRNWQIWRIFSHTEVYYTNVNTTTPQHLTITPPQHLTTSTCQHHNISPPQHYLILSKPSPKTPWQNVCETTASGSIALITANTSCDSYLRVRTMSTSTLFLLYQPLPSMSVTPRRTSVLIASAIS